MKRVLFFTMLLLFLPFVAAYGAYPHGGDTDSDVVLQVYPAIEGTYLDSCAIQEDDWLAGCSEQLAVYWAIHELNVLLDIEH